MRRTSKSCPQVLENETPTVDSRTPMDDELQAGHGADENRRYLLTIITTLWWLSRCRPLKFEEIFPHKNILRKNLLRENVFNLPPSVHKNFKLSSSTVSTVQSSTVPV